MHSFYSPANALYEIIVGVTCLAIWFGAVFSIPALVALMVDGKEEGIHEVFYENGQLQVKEIFLNGKREGLFEMYFKNGRKKLRCFYINDECESIECWDRKGNPAL